MRTWNAPDGGVLRYSYDWTYRGESGYVDVNATYMDKETTNAFLANSYGTYGALVMGILGAVLGKTVAGPYFTGLSIYQAANDSLTRYYIGEANGYGKVSAVYDSISGGSSVVVVGWDTYPTVELNRDDAYDISFTK